MMRAAPFVVSGILVFGPAAAQTAGRGTLPAGTVGGTVDGRAPEKAGATTAVGQTKPPGTTAVGTRPDLEEKSRRLGERINRGICTGCK